MGNFFNPIDTFTMRQLAKITRLPPLLPKIKKVVCLLIKRRNKLIVGQLSHPVLFKVIFKYCPDRIKISGKKMVKRGISDYE